MKHNKQRSSQILILLSCILLLEIIFFLRQKNNIIPSFSYKATTEAEIKDELIIALFMNNIVADSNTFYNNYFSTELEYFNYEFKIKDINKQSAPPYIYITFGITPMIGAHNPVGYDEITYKVDVFGNKMLENFTHIKTYEIPPWLQEGIIKPLP